MKRHVREARPMRKIFVVAVALFLPVERAVAESGEADLNGYLSSNTLVSTNPVITQSSCITGAPWHVGPSAPKDAQVFADSHTVSGPPRCHKIFPTTTLVLAAWY